MTKDQINGALFALAIVAGVVCFVAGHPVPGGLLLTFATGHALQSPLPNRTPTSERVEKGDEPEDVQ